MTLDAYVAALNEKFGGGFETCTPGPRYTRVVRSGSAVCFVDGEGNIYKPASWKTPAKGVRANLATLNMDKVDEYGGWLYR